MGHLTETIYSVIAIIGSMFTGFLYMKTRKQHHEIRKQKAVIGSLKSKINVNNEQHADELKVKNFENDVAEHEVRAVKQSAENNVEDKIDNSNEQHKVKVEL